jgi:hypothetical protein
MSVAIILAALGLAKAYVCEAQPSRATFLTQNLEIMQVAPPSGARKSSFSISVSEAEVTLDQIDNAAVPESFKPFKKIKDKPVTAYYSPSSSFFLTGTAEPTIMMLVMLGDEKAILLSSSPIAATVQNGPADSGGAYLPAVQTGAASCLAVKVAQ